MQTDVTFVDQKVHIKFPWPPPPEKDEVKMLGARWHAGDKVWIAPITYEMAEWLTAHGVVLPETITVPDPPVPEIPEDQSLEEILAESHAADSDFHPAAPKELAYLDFQRAGISWALKRPASLIGDDMGLGKTVQALGVINADPEIKSALIVCPLSVSLNWRNEAYKWLVRGFDIGVATSKRFPRDADIVIVHWAIVQKYAEALRKRDWGLIVLDESHYAKNSKAQRSQAIFGRAARGDTPRLAPLTARRKLALTGTPIPNRPIELYPLLHWLAPRQYDDYYKFATRYCNGYHNGFGFIVDGASNLDELNERLRTIMIRRLKSQVLTELPPKTRQVILLDPNTPELRAVLHKELDVQHTTNEAIAKAKVDVELAKAESPEAYEKAILALRDATQVAFTEISRVRHETALAKLPQVTEHIKGVLEKEGQKVVVFAHHRDVIDALRESLESGDKEFHGIATVSIMGGDSSEHRQEAITSFQTDPKVRVFLGSIGAAKEGITLTAADVSIFAELDWVPGNLSQAEDRIYRIGQENHVLIQHLLVEGSIDAQMSGAIFDKQKVLDEALDATHETPVYELPDTTPIGAGDPDSAMHFDIDAETGRWVADDGAPDEKPRARNDTVATNSVSVDAIACRAEWITPEQIEAVHAGLRQLAAMDDDRAQELNDRGFSRLDVDLGHRLAESESLTSRQAVLGAKLTNKYRRQLPVEYSCVWNDVTARMEAERVVGSATTTASLLFELPHV